MRRKRALYQCEDCAASFDRPYRLANHLRTHTGERPFVCDYEGCFKSYSNSSHLKRHEITHETTSHKCPVKDCSEILKTKATLKNHIDNIHQKKKSKLYKCTECDKDFNKRNWLQSHMFNQHNGKCPYKCPIEDCGKEFSFSSRLKRHMKTHDGHKCKIPGCEEVFLKWSAYVTHLKQFHPKVHKCHVCSKEFFTTSHLKSHREVHEQLRKVFPCDMPNCSRFYFAEKNLIWHMKNYHEARPFMCDVEACHRTFKSKDKLDYHKLRHIKRRRRKKKKPSPSFAAVLSGCADPRKFTRKMPPKRVTSESSDEFTTDEDVTDQDCSIEKSSRQNSDWESTKEEIKTDPSQPSNRKLHKRVRLQSSDEYLSVVEEVCMEKETPQKDICSRPSEGLEGDQELMQTADISSLGETSNWEQPRKLAKFETDERTDLLFKAMSSEKRAAVVSDHATINNSSCCILEDNESSSEYEIITVSILSSVCYKSCSESDEMSSCCMSDAGG